MTATPKQPVRRAPQRTCVGCRATTAKRGLVRVVRTPDQTVMVDPTGRAHGRGAYVHQDADCWRKALSRDALARVLRTTLRPEDRAALAAYADEIRASGAAASSQ